MILPSCAVFAGQHNELVSCISSIPRLCKDQIRASLSRQIWSSGIETSPLLDASVDPLPIRITPWDKKGINVPTAPKTGLMMMRCFRGFLPTIQFYNIIFILFTATWCEQIASRLLHVNANELAITYPTPHRPQHHALHKSSRGLRKYHADFPFPISSQQCAYLADFSFSAP